MNPILLQQQLKNNSKDLLDFCQDLKSWGDEMKEKEQKSHPETKKSSGTKSEPPECSQNKKESLKKKENSDTPKEAKRKCTSYSDWEKFDADKECEKVDESSDSELTDEFDESMKEEALVQKDQGNRFVKTGNWDEAIKRYTKAIEYFAYDPVFYANRALCYLKKNQMMEAENDCTVSLKLDNTYVKAYQRRAVARESLNKLEEAKLDLLRVLEFEPKNSESKSNLEKLMAKIKSVKSAEKSTDSQRTVSKFAASRGQKNVSSSNSNKLINQEVSQKLEKNVVDAQKPSTIWPSGDRVNLVKAIKKPPHLRSKKPLKRITISESNSAIPESSQVVKEDSTWPKQNTVSNTINSCDFKVVEHKLPINEPEKNITIVECKSPKTEKIETITSCADMNKEVKNLNNFDVIFKSKEQEVVNTKKPEIEELVAPKTSVQFHFMWKRLIGQNDKRYEYLKLIEPQNIPSIFKESLESKIFSEILLILADYFIKGNNKVYEYLLYLTEIKRFRALTMFFTLNDKNCLWKMFNQIKECEGRSKEEVDDLITKYEL